MYVLLATDGSPGSETAVSLAATVEWPAGSTVRIVTALPESVPPTDSHPGGPWGLTTLIESENRVLQQLDSDLDAAAERVRRTGAAVETAVVRGRPASVIVDEAQRFGAELVVIGSRGLGPFDTMLLGSVSAEVVDRAPCPVLVARTGTMGRVVVADDGSAGAARGLEFAAAWAPLRTATIRVVTVAQYPPLLSFRFGPTPVAEAGEAWYEARAAETERAAAIADASRARLAATGLTAEAVVRDGDPAGQIVGLAREWPADLVLIGTRGHTGLTRLVLGGTARNVLLNAPCSVLVIKPDEAATGA